AGLGPRLGLRRRGHHDSGDARQRAPGDDDEPRLPARSLPARRGEAGRPPPRRGAATGPLTRGAGSRRHATCIAAGANTAMLHPPVPAALRVARQGAGIRSEGPLCRSRCGMAGEPSSCPEAGGAERAPATLPDPTAVPDECTAALLDLALAAGGFGLWSWEVGPDRVAASPALASLHGLRDDAAGVPLPPPH